MASRTYSGSRIRISDHQANLIVKMIECARPAYTLPHEHDVRYEIKDLHHKVIAQSNRFQLEHPRRPTIEERSRDQASPMWATAAGAPAPGRRDVGHNEGSTTEGR